MGKERRDDRMKQKEKAGNMRVTSWHYEELKLLDCMGKRQFTVASKGHTVVWSQEQATITNCLLCHTI
jgi:predicted CxxxxCH...CXXCH cytochrome family protein